MVGAIHPCDHQMASKDLSNGPLYKTVERKASVILKLRFMVSKHQQNYQLYLMIAHSSAMHYIRINEWVSHIECKNKFDYDYLMNRLFLFPQTKRMRITSLSCLLNFFYKLKSNALVLSFEDPLSKLHIHRVGRLLIPL